MSAPSKDDVYAELRRKGIRAIRVDERIAPVVRKGLRGLRKRDIVLFALVAIVIATVAWVVSGKATRERTALPDPSVDAILADADVQERMRKAIEERKALEATCRKRFVERVKEGTLTKEAANQMFRAMGMEEIK